MSAEDLAEEALQDSCNMDKVCTESSRNCTVGISNECLVSGKSLDNRVSDIKNETINSEEARLALEVCEAKENKSDQSNCYTHLKQNIVWIERVVLTLICVAVAGGFTLPIIRHPRDFDSTARAN